MEVVSAVRVLVSERRRSAKLISAALYGMPPSSGSRPRTSEKSTAVLVIAPTEGTFSSSHSLDVMWAFPHLKALLYYT